MRGGHVSQQACLDVAGMLEDLWSALTDKNNDHSVLDIFWAFLQTLLTKILELVACLINQLLSLLNVKLELPVLNLTGLECLRSCVFDNSAAQREAIQKGAQAACGAAAMDVTISEPVLNGTASGNRAAASSTRDSLDENDGKIRLFEDAAEAIEAMADLLELLKFQGFKCKNLMDYLFAAYALGVAKMQNVLLALVSAITNIASGSLDFLTDLLTVLLVIFLWPLMIFLSYIASLVQQANTAQSANAASENQNQQNAAQRGGDAAKKIRGGGPRGVDIPGLDALFEPFMGKPGCEAKPGKPIKVPDCPFGGAAGLLDIVKGLVEALPQPSCDVKQFYGS